MLLLPSVLWLSFSRDAKSDHLIKVISAKLVGFPGGSVVKNLPANAEDMGLIPGSGRSPGGGNGNPLKYSSLENSMERGAWQEPATPVYGVAKSRM